MIWGFIQNQMLGMKWLNELIGKILTVVGLDVNSPDNFEILFKERQKTDSYNKKYAILDKTESDKYDYNIYAYNGSVNIPMP